MFRYCMTAAALKAFSVSPATRRLYRQLGNTIGGKKRAAAPMPAYYIDRINRMLRIARTYGIPRNGITLLELGTGWCHWEALTTRLFFDIRATLYDVWDNRQIGALHHYLAQLDGSLDQLDISDSQRASVHCQIKALRQLTNYDHLYDLLGFRYIVDPDGDLAGLERNAYDLVVSAGVLEHVSRKDAPKIIRGVGAVLKADGLSVHSINIRDHLYLYDRSVSSKQYLQYSDRFWTLCFQNDVQYINRIQRSGWLKLFQMAGLTLLEEEIEAEDLAGLKIAPEYQSFQYEDLSCGGLRLIHQKQNTAS